MKLPQKTQGFTIIEVVLVLAIAGLIFLMVFIALPALQRTQRDTARKNDVSTVASAVTSYSSSNRGNFPTATQLSTYLDDLSDNTDKSLVTVNTTSPASVAPADGAITVVRGRKCSNNNTAASAGLSAGTLRQFAVVTKLEGGGGQYFCQTS